MMFEPHTIKAVATLLLGEPNAQHSNEKEIRYGTNGSLSLNSNHNTFFDHESKKGGGVLTFVSREKGFRDKSEALDWLKSNGFVLQENKKTPQKKVSTPMSQKSQVPNSEKKAESTDENLPTASPECPNVLAKADSEAKNYNYRDESGALLFQVKR